MASGQLRRSDKGDECRNLSLLRLGAHRRLDDGERRLEGGLDIELGGVEFDRVGGLDERCRRAMRIALVARLDIGEDGLIVARLAALGELARAAGGSCLRRRGDEDLGARPRGR